MKRMMLAAVVLAGTIAMPAAGQDAWQVTPAAEPSRALDLLLLPESFEQKQGNAALSYLMAAQSPGPPFDDMWLKLPLDKLSQGLSALTDADGKRGSSSEVNRVVDLLRLGAYTRDCDWQRPIEQGYEMLLPDLGSHRCSAKLLALSIRVDLAQGKTQQAIEKIKIGLQLARHMAEGPTLIESLVGASIAGLMLDRVEELIQQPGSANLYWALSDLPSPFIDVRQSMGYERDMIYVCAPALYQADRKLTTDEQWAQAQAQLGAVLEAIGVGGNPQRDQVVTTGLSLLDYSCGKQWLIHDCGRKPAEVEAMSVQQVVTRYQLNQYEQLRGEQFKWLSLPYAQAQPYLLAAERQLNQQRRFSLFTQLLPALKTAYHNLVRLDQRVAGLRCVEAVRAYAAGHGGQWPESLDQITTMPIPRDPLTGTSFRYARDGDSFTLDAARPLAGDDDKQLVHFRIHVVQGDQP